MSKHSVFILLFFSAFHINTYAFSDNHGLGARSVGLGNASVSFADLWSAHHNQAALAFVEGIQAGFYYENKFLMKELGLKGGAIVIPLKKGKFGTIAATGYSLGYEKYGESKFGLAYAMKLGKIFSVGIQLDYLLTAIPEQYGANGAFTAEIGVFAKLTKQLTLGAHVFNPMRSKIADYNDERAPTIMRLGLNYNFSNKVLIAVEGEKDLENPFIFKAGIEYHAIEQLYIRIGVATEPFFATFGIGLEIKKFKLDFSSSVHTTLGYSPQISVSYRFN